MNTTTSHHHPQPHVISSQDMNPQPQPHPTQPPQRRPRGFAATMTTTTTTTTSSSPSTKNRKEREKEKERTKLRERHRRAITSRMLSGLRQYGNFPLPARADMNDVLSALAREAGWTVEPDGTTYRQSQPPPVNANNNSHVDMGTYHMRSVESPVSACSLRNSSIKTSIDCQRSVLRIDESFSPASLDSVVVTETDTKADKYTSVSPINSSECLEPDQVTSEKVGEERKE